MKACSLAILIFMSLTACESEEPPTGMPRCEPEGELLVERDLKAGFRSLFEGDSQKARELFRSILDQEKDHPRLYLVSSTLKVLLQNAGESTQRPD